MDNEKSENVIAEENENLADNMPPSEETDNKKSSEQGFFKRLFSGLAKTRDSIAQGFDDIFTKSDIDDEFYDDIEEILIMSDIGVETTTSLIDSLKEAVKKEHIKETEDCRKLLMRLIEEKICLIKPEYKFENQKSVILVIGVNGVGKTTTIGKLASILKRQGKKVMIAAADTFRAAAVDQLQEWSNRAGVDFIKCIEGQDPASVVYDAVKAAAARNIDVLLCDTAGRLHNKKNLMQELEKMHRIITREYEGAYIETLIVLDGTTGQNAMIQAREFMNAAPISGAVITKLDGSSKGGIAIAIQNELSIPIKYIGVGESIEDLQKFDAHSFVQAIFAKSEE